MFHFLTTLILLWTFEFTVAILVCLVKKHVKRSKRIFYNFRRVALDKRKIRPRYDQVNTIKKQQAPNQETYISISKV